MTITIYSTTTCPYCRQLKEYLTSRNIAFSEKLIDQDETAQKEMEGLSNGYLGVPFTCIVSNDGKKETVLGFDKGKLNSVLGIQ